MKVIARIAVVLAGVGLLASLPAGAICALPSTFTSAYYTGTNNDPATALGTFWGLGQFNPATPAGSDSGLAPASSWVRYIGGPGVYLGGDWAGDPAYDGCIQDPPNPQPARMAFVVSMPGAAPGTTAFFGACDQENATGDFYFNEGTGDGVAGTIPKPVVSSTVRDGGTGSVQVTLAAPTTSGGIFDEASCGLAVTGYRVYTQNVPRNAPAPILRPRAAGWTLQGGTNAPNSPAVVTINCAGSQDAYLAYTLVFTDGVELQHVGANSTVVQCGTTAANQPGNFKIIKKPVRVRTEE